MHHRFDDSPDDYDIDMDQRTRMLGGGRGGRVILLGDGTEISLGGMGDDDDDDVDMSDNRVQEMDESSDEKDTEAVQKDQAQQSGSEDRQMREGTPAPADAQKTNSAPADSQLKPVVDSPESTKADTK